MASDSGTRRISDTSNSDNIDYSKPKVEITQQNNKLKVEQEIETQREVGRVSDIGDNYNADNSIPKVDAIHNNASYVQKKVSEHSSNVQFEKTEGIKDKFQKLINKNPFRRDYNGQQKKSRRTLN